MQIVIDIPEWKYKDICEGVEASKKVGIPTPSPSIFEAIANGTPLPKGHGKLGDLGALSDYFWDNRSKLYTHKDLQIILDDAPTIIPADAESGGEE